MSTRFVTNTGNATCTNVANETMFKTFIGSCRTTNDTSRVNNLFTNSEQKFKDNFAQMRAQADDLILTGKSMSSLANLAGATVSGADSRIKSLTDRQTKLKQEIAKSRGVSEASDKEFLESIMNEKPQEEVAPTLQDVTLLLFWLSWVGLVLVLTMIRWTAPNGGWRVGLFTFGLLILVSVMVYALLIKVA
jgi:hypothetical protein